jgi:hypothetical protein
MEFSFPLSSGAVTSVIMKINLLLNLTLMFIVDIYQRFTGIRRSNNYLPWRWRQQFPLKHSYISTCCSIIKEEDSSTPKIELEGFTERVSTRIHGVTEGLFRICCCSDFHSGEAWFEAHPRHYVIFRSLSWFFSVSLVRYGVKILNWGRDVSFQTPCQPSSLKYSIIRPCIENTRHHLSEYNNLPFSQLRLWRRLPSEVAKQWSPVYTSIYEIS